MLTDHYLLVGASVFAWVFLVARDFYTVKI
jgi:hypothetical protein